MIDSIFLDQEFWLEHFGIFCSTDFQREKTTFFILDGWNYNITWIEMSHKILISKSFSAFFNEKSVKVLQKRWKIWWKLFFVIYHWMLTRVPRTWTFSSANFHINYMSMNLCFHFTVLNKTSQRQNFEKITWEMLYNKHEIFQKIKNEMQPADSKF